MRPLVLFVLALGLASAGCGGAGRAAATGPDARASGRAIAALADSLAGEPSTTGRAAVVRRALIRARVTPISDYGRPPAPSPRFLQGLAPTVSGYVPGQHPLGRDELVVLATGLDGPDVPAVLEAARVLVERSEWTTTPERTVQVVFWGDGQSALEGVRQALAAAVWPREAIQAVVVVAEEALAEVDGVLVAPLAPQGDPAALSGALVDRVVQLARIQTLPTDTLAAR